MSIASSETPGERPLEILGVSEAEERVYAWLLTHSGATIPEISQSLTLTYGQAQRLLDAIEVKGLVTRTPSRPRRYVPAAPDIAMKALALRRYEHLQRAEKKIQELKDRAAAVQRQDAQKQTVELITSYEAVCQIFEQMSEAAEVEFVALMRPPMLISRPDIATEEDHSAQRKAQARGVHYRSIMDAAYLEIPGALHSTRADMEAGEKVRMVSHLPFKMLIADRRTALIPLNLEQSDSPSLLLRSSALLDALYSLFEILWERAAPISITPTGSVTAGKSAVDVSRKFEDMIQLMAVGLNDKRIADELEISMRTLRRHTVELMKEIGASTRFQAGWLAALRLSGQRLNE